MNAMPRTFFGTSLVILAWLALFLGPEPVMAQGGIRASGEIESTNGGFRFPDDSLQTSAAQAPRRFYVTNDQFFGDHGGLVCASGYHFASIWEVLDVSHLRYAKDHRDAWSPANEDQGDGPPTGLLTWVRTGLAANLGTAAGRANCLAWTSAAADHRGTVVWLPDEWSAATNPASLIAPWASTSVPCNGDHWALCVED